MSSGQEPGNLAPAGVASGPDDHESPAPRAEYARRLEDRRAAQGRWSRLDARLADARLAAFGAAVLVLGLAVWSGRFGWAWSLAPALAFGAAVVAHGRARRAGRVAGRAADLYARGLARVDGQWPGSGTAGERFLDPDHPYAADLDLFGRGSLFERLCTARTTAGEATLAAWLLAPADAEAVRGRQAAVAELRPRLGLREDLWMLGADVREGVDPEALAAWGAAPPVRRPALSRVLATALAVCGLAALAAWAFTGLGPSPLCAVVLADAGFIYSRRRWVRRVLAGVGGRSRDLDVLAGLLARLEREPFTAPALLALRGVPAGAGGGAIPASRRVAELARLVQLLEARGNQAFAPLAALLLWSNHLALAVDAWKARNGREVAAWLAAVGEFEALCALAAYAYENPDDPFPDVGDGPAGFDAEGLGHPLLPDGACVRNDVRLGDGLQVLLVSGSNMSGKSTLLRSVGVNAVLALAGAPVRARRLQLSVLAVGATLRVQDSLQAGTSRFYAELTRLRLLVDLARGPRPLLFLLDEIFHGTNSRDRAVGAGGLVRGLIDRGAVGLVTTHDLALAEIADALAPRAANVHFRDDLIDGVMRFDYRMRPGVVRHSNALALMRAVGLDV